ncbi:MAG: DUF2089 family protein [Anaerolineae bacterium]|nr:DUF2089 domain-containing protein [Anaerolineales bacterium]MCQ3977230.1 hypothetical protein [Anaerolineae bacterium]
MIQLAEHCPFCSANITTIKQYSCDSCGTTFDGHFALPELHHPLTRLSPAQLDFVLAFVRCEGKLNRLEAELGVSYPTVRHRLNEVITALGGEPQPEAESPVPLSTEPTPNPAPDDQNNAPRTRKQVLDNLAAGKLSPEEAMRLLRGLQ